MDSLQSVEYIQTLPSQGNNKISHYTEWYRHNLAPKQQILDSSKVKRSADDNFMKMTESFQKGRKHCRENEKLLVTTNFSFSHSVFKRMYIRHIKTRVYFGKGLRAQITCAEQYHLNFLSSDKIFYLTKMKGCADEKSKATQNLNFLFKRVERNVEKSENAGYLHFFLFPQCFQKGFIHR